MRELSCSGGRQTADGRRQMADGGWQKADGRRRMADGGRQTKLTAVIDIAAAARRSLPLSMFLTAAARPHHPTAVVIATVSSYVFLCRRCAAVHLPIPTASATTTTITRTTRTTTTAPATDQSPPAAEAARSIVSLPRGGGVAGCDDDGRRRRRRRVRLG